MQTRVTGIPTYVIANNRLAGEYLVQVLRDDSALRPILCDKLPEPRLRSVPSVFIIEGTMPIPLRECIRRLHSLFPKGRFLMVDRYQPDKEVLLLMNLGFHGFVEHSRVAKALVSAVRAVGGGRLWFSEELMQQYVHANAEGSSSREGQLYLTPRETEVLELVRRRLSNLEIAVRLGITENTVKYHVYHILAKFRVSNRRELETSSVAGVGQIWDQLSK
jgi:DNA-binding NarL/FixJ family response regulator